MKYRIVKHYYKDKEENLCFEYLIEQLTHHKGLFKCWDSWEAVQKCRHTGESYFVDNLSFQTEKLAQEHIKKLLTPVPSDEIIKSKHDTI